MKKNPSKKKWKLILFLCAFLGLIAGAGFFLRRQSQNAKIAEIKKKTVKVERKDIRKELVLSGKVLPLSSVAVYSPVSGQIREIFVQEGGAVKHDARLFSVIQDTTGQRELEAAESDYQRAALEMRVSQEAVERRQSVIDLFSDAENSRLEDEASRRKLEFQVAQQRLNLLRESLGLLKGAAGKQNSKRTTTKDGESVIFVKAPKAGIVTFINKSVGESVLATTANADASGREVLTISDVEQMIVRSRILESDLALVKINTPVTLKLDAYRDKEYEGVVSRISQQGVEDRNAGYTYFVTDVIFKKPDADVRAQMNSTIRLLVSERKNVLTLPAIAVASLNGNSIVEQLPANGAFSDPKAKYQKVSIGLTTETSVEITDPQVREGEEFLEIDFSKLDLKALAEGKLGEDDKTAERKL